MLHGPDGEPFTQGSRSSRCPADAKDDDPHADTAEALLDTLSNVGPI